MLGTEWSQEGWERAGPGLGPGQEISWGKAAAEERSRPIDPQGFSDCFDARRTSPSHPPGLLGRRPAGSPPTSRRMAPGPGSQRSPNPAAPRGRAAPARQVTWNVSLRRFLRGSSFWEPRERRRMSSLRSADWNLSLILYLFKCKIARLPSPPPHLLSISLRSS